MSKTLSHSTSTLDHFQTSGLRPSDYIGVSGWYGVWYRFSSLSRIVHSYIWRSQRNRWMAVPFEQWGFISVSHLLWQGPVTLTPIAKHLAVELSPLFLRIRSLATGIRTHLRFESRWRLTKKRNTKYWKMFLKLLTITVDPNGKKCRFKTWENRNREDDRNTLPIREQRCYYL